MRAKNPQAHAPVPGMGIAGRRRAVGRSAGRQGFQDTVGASLEPPSAASGSDMERRHGLVLAMAVEGGAAIWKAERPRAWAARSRVGEPARRAGAGCRKGAKCRSFQKRFGSLLGLYPATGSPPPAVSLGENLFHKSNSRFRLWFTAYSPFPTYARGAEMLSLHARRILLDVPREDLRVCSADQDDAALRSKVSEAQVPELCKPWL